MKQFLKRWFEILIILIGLVFLGWLVTYRSASYGTYSTAEAAKRDLIKSITITGQVNENKDGKYLETFIAEKNYLDVEENDPVTIDFDAVSDASYEGKIRSISDTPYMHGNTTAYKIEVVANDFPKDILKGMHADIKIITDEKQDRISIPNIAVKKDGDSYYVDRVIIEQRINIQKFNFERIKKTIKKTSVEIGFEGDEYTEIVNGLKIGDAVISSLY